jgi:transcriptional regulator with XRE-family HTH domain
MDHKGWSKAAMAEACGVLPQNINRYLTGRSDPSKIIINLISSGLNPDWARSGTGSMIKDHFNSPVSSVKRQLKVEESLDNYYREGDPYMIPAIGPLMTPEKIKEGDVLIINPKATPEDGDFVLVKTDAGPKIDRYQEGEAIVGVVVKIIRERSILRQ